MFMQLLEYLSYEGIVMIETNKSHLYKHMVKCLLTRLLNCPIKHPLIIIIKKILETVMTTLKICSD